VYGSPDAGRYSERIIFTVNDREFDVAPDGSFAFVMGPQRPDGHDGLFLATAPDAVAAASGGAGSNRTRLPSRCLSKLSAVVDTTKD
jgi:hypothetical protein